MPQRAVSLPGSIFLVPGKALDGAWRQKTRDHPHIPAGPQALDNDLNAMNAEGGVPARIDRPRRPGDDPSLLVYGRTFALRLFPTGRRTGYIMASINPLRLADHGALATASLLIRPASWEVTFELRRVPQGSSAFWPQISAEWSACQQDGTAQQKPNDLASEHQAFLDTLDRLIDADEKISTEKADPSASFAYRAVKPTGEMRHGRHPYYEFELAGPSPDEDTFVQVRGEPEQRGQVTRCTGRSAVVRFDQPVDWDRIPRQGQLDKTPNSVVYRKQREAVQVLREGMSRHPSLLPLLAGQRPAPARPAADEPAEPLDADQLKAYRMALGVQDLLLVLGPPGTGKTRTITQIARSTALGMAGIRAPARVLITSHTHRAVDNVLTRLPRELQAIRVGTEGRVTADGRPFLIDQQAAEIRTGILNRTSRSLAAFRDMPVAEQWARELADCLDRLTTAIAAQGPARAAFDAARRAAGGPAQARVDRILAQQARGEQALARNADRAGRLTRRLERVQSRTGWPVLGAAFRALAQRRERRLASERGKGRELNAAQQRRQAELAMAEQELDAATRGHPAVEEARAAADRAAQHRDECRGAALKAARVCRDIVGRVEPVPADPENQDPERTERALATFHTWLTGRLPVLADRAQLLAEWNEEVSGETEQLFPELIRYADVVAATCIGVASRPELSDVDFDLAILDEAGQIGVANALVPLVRARRAVLVGDHRQLPPFLDSEMAAWGEGIGDPVIKDLMAKSALEWLVDKFPASNVISLTWQRRMPPAIADFISDSFYEGNLHTAISREHRDLLFRSPLAFVDTASLPPGERQETSGRGRERWDQPGYTNTAEAELLTELAGHYHRQGREWAVIVPYKAQATQIMNAVTAFIGDAQLARLNVGTVDSFQGGERDVILYGFTRSNREGRVGFLDELRRANVAFSRARYQLVMVGDMGTLTDARDQRFRDLARALRSACGRARRPAPVPGCPRSAGPPHPRGR